MRLEPSIGCYDAEVETGFDSSEVAFSIYFVLAVQFSTLGTHHHHNAAPGPPVISTVCSTLPLRVADEPVACLAVRLYA